MHRKHTYRKNGFTLIEVMIIVCIIGILSYLAIISVTKMRHISRDQIMCAQLRELYSATHFFWIGNERYPNDLDELVDQRYFTAKVTDSEMFSGERVFVIGGLEIGFDLDVFNESGVDRSPIPIPKVWAVSDDLSYGHDGSFHIWRGAGKSKNPWELTEIKNLEFLVNPHAPFSSE